MVKESTALPTSVSRVDLDSRAVAHRSPTLRPYLRFSLDGHECLIVPAGEELPPRTTPIGQLAIEGQSYRVVSLDRTRAAEQDQTRAIVDILTPRELQVALLVARGRINKQIADQLQLSEYTVSTHLRRIYAKLGVRTRAAMVARVIRHMS